MLRRVHLGGVLSMLRGMKSMALCRMSMVCRLFMVPGLVILGRFAVMQCCARVVIRGMLVVFSRFLGHGNFSVWM